MTRETEKQEDKEPGGLRGWWRERVEGFRAGWDGWPAFWWHIGMTALGMVVVVGGFAALIWLDMVNPGAARVVVWGVGGLFVAAVVLVGLVFLFAWLRNGFVWFIGVGALFDSLERISVQLGQLNARLARMEERMSKGGDK